MSTDAATEFDAATIELGDKIVGLTLLEAKRVVDYLKEKHGIEPAGGGAPDGNIHRATCAEHDPDAHLPAASGPNPPGANLAEHVRSACQSLGEIPPTRLKNLVKLVGSVKPSWSEVWVIEAFGRASNRFASPRDAQMPAPTITPVTRTRPPSRSARATSAASG